MPVIRRMLTCCIRVVTCWERSDLLALLYVMFVSHSQITHLTQDTIWETFPYGVLGQVWYLIVWIPDLCILHCYYLMYTYAKFDQNIPVQFKSYSMSIFTKRTRPAKMMFGNTLSPFCILFANWPRTDWRTDSHSDYSTTHNRRNFLFFLENRKSPRMVLFEFLATTLVCEEKLLFFSIKRKRKYWWLFWFMHIILLINRKVQPL